MGSVCAGEEEDDSQRTTDAKNALLSEEDRLALEDNKDEEKYTSQTSYFITFNETITSDVVYHYTLTSTTLKYNTSKCKILKTKNYKNESLCKIGDRVSDTSNIMNDGVFYALLRRNENNDDYNELQKYQILNYNNKNTNNMFDNDKNIKFKYCKTECKFLNGKNVNLEGLDILLDEYDELMGYIMVNGFSDEAPKTELYYLKRDFEKNDNNEAIVDTLYVFDNDGVMALGCVNYINGLGLDGFIFLPQSLCLSYIDNDKQRKWDLFEKWTITNLGNANLIYISKSDLLKLIKGENQDNINTQFIPCELDDGYNSTKNLFYKHSKKNGYQQDGFQALSFDDNFNGILTCEVTNISEKETFNFIIGCRFQKDKNGKVKFIINACDKKIAEANGGGENRSQEASLFLGTDIEE